MINKSIVFTYILIGIFCFIGGFGICYYKYVKGFHFNNEIPKFNQRQNEIIKNTYTSAILLLNDPANWYVTEVIETDTNISLGFSVLSRLQDGVNSNGNIISTTFDGYYRIDFDKNYD